jgi:hypothetical protein
MIQAFEKKYLLRGTFSGQGFEIKNCDCEVIVNPLDTTSITARIYALPEDLHLDFKNCLMESWEDVQFTDNRPGRSSHLRGKIKRQTAPDTFDVVAELEVFDFTKYTVFENNDDTGDEIEMCFILTPCNFLQLGYDFKFDAKKGYLRGVHPWTDKYRDETVAIELPWGKIELYRNMYISAPDPSIMILAEPPSITISIRSNNNQTNILWDEAESKLADILPLISYIDAQTVNWTTVNTKIKKNNVLLMVVEQFQSLPNIPRVPLNNPNESILKERRDLFGSMLEHYLSLPTQLKTALIDSIRTYLMGTIANMPPDTQILLFQSAIETLTKYFENEVTSMIKTWAARTPKASRKVLAICELHNIDLHRYYENIDLGLIKAADSDKLPFIEFRDSIAHSGIYPDGKTKEDALRQAHIAEKLIRVLLFNVIRKHGKKIEGFKISNQDE